MRTHLRLLISALVPLALAGCAATSPAPPSGGAPASTPSALPDSIVVIGVKLDRKAELANDRGALRVLAQDLYVEYRRGGRGQPLDAGEVTLDGRALERIAGSKGVRYHLGRDDSPGANQSKDDPWVTLAHQGAEISGGSARVRLAPFPVVTQPGPDVSIRRSDELSVVMLPPAASVWYRVSLVGSATVYAIDLGSGRWLFQTGSLAPLSDGRAHILIEIESSCAECDITPRLRASVSSRSELEIPVTLL